MCPSISGEGVLCHVLSRLLPDDAWTGEVYLSVEKCRAMVRNANAFVGGRGRPKAYLYLCNNVTHSEWRSCAWPYCWWLGDWRSRQPHWNIVSATGQISLCTDRFVPIAIRSRGDFPCAGEGTQKICIWPVATVLRGRQSHNLIWFATLWLFTGLEALPI